MIHSNADIFLFEIIEIESILRCRFTETNSTRSKMQLIPILAFIVLPSISVTTEMGLKYI